MNPATYSLIETTGLWQVTRDGSLLAGFVAREMAESFLMQEVDALRAEGNACRVVVRAQGGARSEWRCPGGGMVGIARQLH
jgi:hypothetical protein